MNAIIPFVVAIVLLLAMLDLAMSFLTSHLGIFKRTGAIKAGRWAARFTWRGVVGVTRLLLKRRRPRIRRHSSRVPTGYLR
jgi:hypothetical protein